MDEQTPIDKKRINVLLIISGLTFGGAERQVIELANKLDKKRFLVSVCALTDDNPMATYLRTDLFVVNKKVKFDISVVTRLRRFVAERRIDVIHAFLNDANIAGRLCYRFGGRPVIISSERNSDYEESLLRRVVERLTRPCMNLMIANSMAGKQFCLETRKMRDAQVAVVHNGVDSKRFHENAGLGESLRSELDIARSVPLIGMIGNFKAQKNHKIFVRMASDVLAKNPDARFLIVGNSPEGDLQGNAYYQETKAMSASLGLGDKMMFLSARSDMEKVHNACDVTVLPSSREGTPNVMLESMACATPVVASNVADNSFVLRDQVDGRIVNLRDHDRTARDIANAVIELLADETKRKRMGQSARARVEEEFSLARLAEKTARIYIDQLELAVG